MQVKTIRKIKKIRGKKILLRVDFNVPIKNKKVSDDFKIIKTLPTIRFLLRYNCRIILLTHLGDPNPKKKEIKYSVAPIAKRLGEILHKQIKLVKNFKNFSGTNVIGKMKEGEIVMLENIRYEKGEKENNVKLAKDLANISDIYINDAFAVCHRAQASICAIKKFLPYYAGLLMEKEIINLNKILKPKKPLIVVMGGAKIETKIKMIKNLKKNAFRILIGGALANNFIKAAGYEVGNSLIDLKSVEIAKKNKDNKIVFPIDVVTTTKLKNGKPVVKKLKEVNVYDYILDIGPETIKLFNNLIKRGATIVWNGPMGKFEDSKFKHGTLAIGQIIAARSSGSAFGVAGGGETIEALKMTKMIHDLDWVSTGGGAMLAYLGGEKMPGLVGLIKK